MRFKRFILAGAGFVVLGLLYSHHARLNRVITKEALQAHVSFLSSDALEGRLTGSRGEQLATQYAANIFGKLGLEPAGDHGTYFQEFEFTAGVALGNNNSFAIRQQNGALKHLALNRDWRPLSFSGNHAFNGAELVFAGYGITAPAAADVPAYDSYHGLQVKNKWVVVFRYVPERISAAQSRQLSQYSSLRYKAFTARENGARGIIFVSGPNSKVKNELIALSSDAVLTGSGIVAVSVTDAVANDLLQSAGTPFRSLQSLQDKLDTGQLAAPHLSGIKVAGQVNIKQIKQRGRNVLARLKLGDAAAPLLVVSAHIDHLGRGELSGSRSREHESRSIHNGADDNASGVASVLEAASALNELKIHGRLRGNHDILFALWSGEESGLLGSSHFINGCMDQVGKKNIRSLIAANINLDMVGRLRKNLVVQGVGSSLDWAPLIERTNKKHDLSIIMQNDPYLPTDATAFYLQAVPAINLFTGSHDEYHSPRDRADTLNYAGLQSISNFLADFILALEAAPQPLRYRQAAKTDRHPGRGFRVYLGTIPDYASPDITGVKLSGVTKDSPADRAGLRQGDVIVALAGKPIRDIYDYTFALRALRAGVPVALLVQRGPSHVSLQIAAEARE